MFHKEYGRPSKRVTRMTPAGARRGREVVRKETRRSNYLGYVRKKIELGS